MVAKKMTPEERDQLLDQIHDDIADMDVNSLIATANSTYDSIKDPVMRETIAAFILLRAEKLKAKYMMSRLIASNRAIAKKREKEAEASLSKAQRVVVAPVAPVTVDCDVKGTPLVTIENILHIMRDDPQYYGIRFNEVSNVAEVNLYDDGGGAMHIWSDADESASMEYIERVYHIYSREKHTAALRIFFGERRYNPIMDYIETLQWDGQNRCELFLSKWMLCEDTPYTREVSRLIFAGGINRLYNPGCKFDDVPVLVGTKQGEGKSTIIQWLVINDIWFGDVKKVEGSDSVEAITGKWICEIPELAAFKRNDDIEAIKAFVTRQVDKYRKPYDRNPEELPRRCTFIGTTNNDQFLSDKTGNRRFYPVKVQSNGYDLYEHEKECRAYIDQCWAEARDRMILGKMDAFANRELIEEYRAAQENAMEDDWRVGKIQQFLEPLAVGSVVCAVQIFCECLYDDTNLRPKRADSLAIAQIMARMDGWEAVGPQYTTKYGRQRCWRCVKNDSPAAGDLPF